MPQSPLDHAKCCGYVVGLPHECIAAAMAELEWKRGEFLVSYEKSPISSPPVVCLYNSGSSLWCTETTATYACPYCTGTSHTFDLSDTIVEAPWFGIHKVRCKDGETREFGLYIPA